MQNNSYKMDYFFADFVSVPSVFLDDSLCNQSVKLDNSRIRKTNCWRKLFGIIASGFIRPRDYRKYEKIQIIVGIVIGITIFFTVIILEKQFPSYYNVMININS